MTARGSKSFRAWRGLVVGLVVMLAPPVCAAAPKSHPVPSEAKKDAASAPPAPVAVAKPGPSRSATTDARTIVRKASETPEQLAARILPAGADTITKPLEFELGPLGTVVLILYQVDSDDPVFVKDPSVYRGLVLVRTGKPDVYRIEPLPSQSAGVGTLMYEVKSVFAADADGEGAPELCVLSEAREVGGGDTGNSHVDTDIFKWSGSRFKLVEQDDSRPLSDLRTAKAVRAKLKKTRP